LTKVNNTKSRITHLGYGDPLIGFWPYFLHEYSSDGISAIFELIAGTLTVFFTRFFLNANRNYSGQQLSKVTIMRKVVNVRVMFGMFCFVVFIVRHVSEKKCGLTNATQDKKVREKKLFGVSVTRAL